MPSALNGAETLIQEGRTTTPSARPGLGLLIDVDTVPIPSSINAI